MEFIKRAQAFKDTVNRAMKKYGVTLTAGYIHAWEEESNIIIQDSGNESALIYFKTLTDREDKQ